MLFRLNKLTSKLYFSSLPNSADVVVIGGGVIGTSTLYNLAKQGITNTVLLEQKDLTCGTTWHSAGLFWSLRPTDIELELLYESKKQLLQLEEETEISPGWINNGGLFTASTPERLNEYKRMNLLGKYFGIESSILKNHEIKDLCPLINTKDLVGALYSPGDGTVEPTGITNAYAKGSKMLGAKIIEKCSVTDIITENNKVKSVITPYGKIDTNIVVNCAGAWGKYIGNMIKIPTPLCAMKHVYIITEPIPDIGNIPNIRDHDLSIYLKLQGKTLALGGYEPNPEFWKPNKDVSPFSLFDLNWDIFEKHFKSHILRMPILENVGLHYDYIYDNKEFSLVGAHRTYIPIYMIICLLNGIDINMDKYLINQFIYERMDNNCDYIWDGDINDDYCSIEFAENKQYSSSLLKYKII